MDRPGAERTWGTKCLRARAGPQTGESGGRRRNSDSGVLDSESPRDSQGGVKRHASTLDKSGNKRQLVSSLDTSLESQESRGE